MIASLEEETSINSLIYDYMYVVDWACAGVWIRANEREDCKGVAFLRLVEGCHKFNMKEVDAFEAKLYSYIKFGILQYLRGANLFGRPRVGNKRVCIYPFFIDTNAAQQDVPRDTNRIKKAKHITLLDKKKGGYSEAVLECVGSCIDLLPQRDKQLINMYYYSQMRVKEISKVLDLSHSRISTLLKKAKDKLSLLVRRNCNE